MAKASYENAALKEAADLNSLDGWLSGQLDRIDENGEEGEDGTGGITISQEDYQQLLEGMQTQSNTIKDLQTTVATQGNTINSQASTISGLSSTVSGHTSSINSLNTSVSSISSSLTNYSGSKLIMSGSVYTGNVRPATYPSKEPSYSSDSSTYITTEGSYFKIIKSGWYTFIANTEGSNGYSSAITINFENNNYFGGSLAIASAYTSSGSESDRSLTTIYLSIGTKFTIEDSSGYRPSSSWSMYVYY